MSEKAFQFLLDEACGRHPLLSASLKQVGPLFLSANRDVPFAEKLCRSIAGQQLSIKAAQTIWSRVQNSAGPENLMTHLEQASPEQLRSCGLSAAKTKAIKGITKHVKQGALDCDALAHMTPMEREKVLISLWGVGRWTIDMMNIFYFGEPDIWPENDVTACKTLMKLTGEQDSSVKAAAFYAPYRSFLALYMYEIADAKPT